MTKLTAKQRAALPDADFAGPNRTYPIEDRGHAVAAKARAAQAVHAGRMSATEAKQIDDAADQVLQRKP